MFSDSPVFIRVRTVGQQVARRSSVLLLLPGLVLTAMALAILIWPALLAYLVASVMLLAGLGLLFWGWTVRQTERRRRTNTTIRYEVY
ncbi:MAG TPA: hypothetical protein PKE45_00790 [Caldilineaceae bacterium]|nr:hypothetical protein [Caldilineaceae bacterium]